MEIIAKAVIFDRDNHILILKRSQTHPRFPHHLDFPGGIVEAGEQADEAVKREISEESGLEIDLDALNLVYSQPVSDHLLHLVFSTKLDQPRPNIRLSWEHAGFEWLAYDEILSKGTPINVDKYYLTVLEYLASR